MGMHTRLGRARGVAIQCAVELKPDIFYMHMSYISAAGSIQPAHVACMWPSARCQTVLEFRQRDRLKNTGIKPSIFTPVF